MDECAKFLSESLSSQATFSQLAVSAKVNVKLSNLKISACRFLITRLYASFYSICQYQGAVTLQTGDVYFHSLGSKFDTTNLG